MCDADALWIQDRKEARPKTKAEGSEPHGHQGRKQPAAQNLWGGEESVFEVGRTRSARRSRPTPVSFHVKTVWILGDLLSPEHATLARFRPGEADASDRQRLAEADGIEQGSRA